MSPRLLVASAALAAVLIAVVLSAGTESSSSEPRAAAVGLDQVGHFADPVHVSAPRNDPSRLFVVERAGRVRVVLNGRTLSRPFLDIRSRVSCCLERGLLSIAFAPDYERSRRFYVFFTDNTGDLRVYEWRTSARDPNRAESRPLRSLMKVRHRRFINHNGGQVAFGPDGRLYISTGDGGGGNDPFNNAQRRSKLGKILRVDPRSRRPRVQIYARGLRNPYRFSFDRTTGDMIIGDVGEGAIEEVNFKQRGRARGANFGWDVFEGTRRVRRGRVRGHDKPVIQHSHRAGWCSVIGGFVVRDRASELFGRYVYADHCNDELYSARMGSGGARGVRGEGVEVSRITSFGEDATGRVYATSLDGPVWRLR